MTRNQNRRVLRDGGARAVFFPRVCAKLGRAIAKYTLYTRTGDCNTVADRFKFDSRAASFYLATLFSRAIAPQIIIKYLAGTFDYSAVISEVL